MRNKIIVISIFFLSFSILVRAQDTQILDKDMFDTALDSLIENKFYEDSCKDIRVSFACPVLRKVDSYFCYYLVICFFMLYATFDECTCSGVSKFKAQCGRLLL